MHGNQTPAQRIADLRASTHYLIAWDQQLLGWVLTYSGQTLASVCAYLPGRPAIAMQAAQTWADGLIGPQQWQRVSDTAAAA